MDQQNCEKYISLMDATKFCNYSQEYLSLRARRGKLKSVKQGRNWVTTKEWLDEYIRKTESYKEELAKKNRDKEIFFKIKTTPFSIDKKQANNLAPVFVAENYCPSVMVEGLEKGNENPLPPENLPIEKISFSKLSRREAVFSFLKIGFSLGLVFGVLVGALIFNRIFLANLLSFGHDAFVGFFKNAAYSSGVFSDYFSWLGEKSTMQNLYGLADLIKIINH